MYRAGNWSASLTVPLDSQCISTGELFSLYYYSISNYNNTEFTVTPTESSSQSLLIFFNILLTLLINTAILSLKSTDTQEPTQSLLKSLIYC